MKPETALKLVSDYSALTRAIRDCKKQIGEHLNKCPGLNGYRLEHETVGDLRVPSARSQNDQDTHLKSFYTPERDDHGYLEWADIEDMETECSHCYAAHLVIQKRKALRRSLGAVKSAMTRLGAQ